MKQNFVLKISSNTVDGPATDLGTSGFEVVYVSHNAAAEVSFRAATTIDGTYYPINRENSAVVGMASTLFSVGTAVTGAWVPADCLKAFRFIKAVATATAANGADVRLSTVIAR